MAVTEGRLVQLRSGAYCDPAVPPDFQAAGRAKGRLTCISALHHLGVFVVEHERLHVSVEPTTSRFSRPPLPHRLHRRKLVRRPEPDALCVEPLDAVYDAIRCQSPRSAVATIDSALHLGLIDAEELDEVLGMLPHSYRMLGSLVDPRAESGPETLMRLILRSLPCVFDLQVSIPGVGRVDFLVDEWLIVECDSRTFHADWAAQRKDRRRDSAAAEQGLVTFRAIAEDIMWHREEVRAALAGLLASPWRRAGGGEREERAARRRPAQLRRMGDSNPRGLSPNTLSKRAP